MEVKKKTTFELDSSRRYNSLRPDIFDISGTEDSDRRRAELVSQSLNHGHKSRRDDKPPGRPMMRFTSNHPESKFKHLENSPKKQHLNGPKIFRKDKGFALAYKPLKPQAVRTKEIQNIQRKQVSFDLKLDLSNKNNTGNQNRSRAAKSSSPRTKVRNLNLNSDEVSILRKLTKETISHPNPQKTGGKTSEDQVSKKQSDTLI